MKRVLEKTAKITAAILVITALAASMSACGNKEETSQDAQQKEQETAPAAATLEETINPEQINPEQISLEETDAKEEDKSEAEDASGNEEQEAEVIKKPEPSEADLEEKEQEEPAGEEEAEKKDSSSTELAILGEGIVFDGMELSFPIELSADQLGNWKLTYQNVDDPSSMTLAPGEIVTAVMTNPAFKEEDVTVTAEFGNYGTESADLSDIPMTGIYVRRTGGSSGEEKKIPELVLPGGLTWGSSESEIMDVLGEASFSSGSGDQFDSMYENGSFLVEFSGSKETGVDYMVYCVE